MRIRIVKPGILSTIQSLGRESFLAEAVPRSGAVDTLSCRIANIVLGNPENSAVIEFTYHGAVLYAETDLLIAFCGEGAVLLAGSELIPSNRPVFIPASTTFSLEKSTGCRSYLAISGGFAIDDTLGSKSTFLGAGFGGLEGRTLKEDDLLKNDETATPKALKLYQLLKSDNIAFPKWGVQKNTMLPTFLQKTVHVIPGREFTTFSAESLLAFLSEPFKVGLRSNRMAYQLEGKTVKRNKSEELISTAVTAGTIQVSGDGKLMLLMADCQTTGGYPRIAQVAAADLPVCAQLKPGDEIFFEEISRKDAERLLLQQEQLLRELKATIKLKI
jgi:antagonist of KipI